MLKTSVRNLIEFVMRSGNIDDSYVSQDRAMMGIRAHQKLQREYPGDYQAEVKLTNTSEYGGMTFLVEGRADGIIKEGDLVIIDEIKSTTMPLDQLKEDSNPLHWAQAIVYAYFYAVDKNKEIMSVQLSYYNIDEEEILRFRRAFTYEDLKEFYEDLLLSYLDFSKKLVGFKDERNKSLEGLAFPFKAYRKGQREMAESVYKTIIDKRDLFLEAPTGIGKTISAIFPTLKAIGQGKFDKVFYLTARGTTKDQAHSAIENLIEKDLRIKAVTFNSKEQMCINEKLSCNLKDCPYARGHFDRVNDALVDILVNEDLMGEEIIKTYSRAHNVCPFELQLDIGTYSSFVTCDYNYAFDPKVYLRRFFDSASEDYVFLIDEAHNLIDRAREMYSAELRSEDLLRILEFFTGEYVGIRRAAGRLLSKFETYRSQVEKKNYHVQKNEAEDLSLAVKNLASKLDPFLGKEKAHQDYDLILNTYFQLASYRRISLLYDESYRTIFSFDDEDRIIVRQLCIDLRTHFKNLLSRARSSIFFSATLTPMDYYVEMLSGEKKPYRLHLPSPFPQENLHISTLASVSTKFKDRTRTLASLVEAIEDFISARKGNYLIFFPSYAYMSMAVREFENRNPDREIMVQSSRMSQEERNDFLAAFNRQGEKIAFAVLGGIFSEGIDLIGEALIGCVVVSVGLPGLSVETNAIRDFYFEKNRAGYDYAYKYPGMNKILQAAGRVIRTDKDRGSVLLIDPRFAEKDYRVLMPRHWSHIKTFYDLESLREDLNYFWNTNKKIKSGP